MLLISNHSILLDPKIVNIPKIECISCFSFIKKQKLAKKSSYILIKTETFNIILDEIYSLKLNFEINKTKINQYFLDDSQMYWNQLRVKWIDENNFIHYQYSTKVYFYFYSIGFFSHHPRRFAEQRTRMESTIITFHHSSYKLPLITWVSN